MSAPERPAVAASAPLRWRRCALGILEWHARRGAAAALRTRAQGLGIVLPEHGRAAFGARLVLGVRPERWWILGAPAAHAATSAAWQAACVDAGGAVELSSAFDALLLQGARVPELLARACRLDLAADAFPPGRVAATPMLQAAAVLVALPVGWLWLTPSSLGREAREWLEHAGAPFGGNAGPDADYQDLIEGTLS